MSSPSEDPEEAVAGDAGTPEQDGPVVRSRSSSYPPPPPGASVQVRGTVRVSDRPPPASDGDLQLELDPEETEAVLAEEAADEGELEIDVEEPASSSEAAPPPPAPLDGAARDPSGASHVEPRTEDARPGPLEASAEEVAAETVGAGEGDVPPPASEVAAVALEEDTEEAEAEALPVEEAAEEAEALPVEEAAEEAEAPPVEEDLGEAEALPVEEDLGEAEALPVEEDLGEAEVEALPVEEAAEGAEAVPVEEAAEEAEAVPVEEDLGEAEALPVEEDLEEADTPAEDRPSEEQPVAAPAPVEERVAEGPSPHLVAQGADAPPVGALPTEAPTAEGAPAQALGEDPEPLAEEPTEELEIEEVEEEDPETLELQEVEAEEESQPAPPAPEPPKPPVRSRKRPWFEGFFNDDYLRTVPPPTDKEVKRQCDFIERALGLEHGATILDVGCGLGMHAVELTSRGYLVVGLDLSLAMLSRAGDEAQDRGLKINFLHGDMREMAFEGAFDAVLCWGTTFGYFDDEANRKVIARLYKALKPGGVLLLDVVNRDFVISKQPNLIWFEGDGCVCMEETTFNHITSRLEVKRTVILDDGRQRETKYTLRLYSLHELGQILHLQGFRVAEVSGGEATPGVYLGADSPRLIILAERRMRPSTPPTAEQTRPSTGELSIPPPPPAPSDGTTNGEGP